MISNSFTFSLNEGFYLHSRITTSIFDSEAPFLFFNSIGWGEYNLQIYNLRDLQFLQAKLVSLYSKASRYTASTYTDFTDTRFLIGSRKIQVTLILSLFFTDTRFFTSGKIKIIEFSLLKSEFVH